MVLCVAVAMGGLQAKTDKKAKNTEPVVMTINGRDIPRSEFLYFYEKNNSVEETEQKSFDEYVDLFINFRLKVEEALSRGVDTTQAYKDELEGYRKQLAEPYLQVQNWVDDAIALSLERSAQEVHAAHILISCEKDASPEKVADAKKRLAKCKEMLSVPGASFDSIARIYSEDPSARQNGGDLGYFSSMQMVYPFEEAAFNTPVGEMSEVRSQFGFHLIKVYDKRKGAGEVIPAHIMLNLTPTMNEEQREAVKVRIDSIYREIVDNKRPFEEVCAAVSQDGYTAKMGGKYNWMGTNARFPKEWLDVAFSLEKGEVSKPFATRYGWHIMTVIDKRDQTPDSPELRAQLRQRFEHDADRKEAAVRRQQDKWIVEEHMTFNAKVRASVEAAVVDTTLEAEALHSQMAKQKKPLLTLATEKYSALQFAQWLTEKYGVTTFRTVAVDEALDVWSREVLTQYEDAHLIDKNVEYANIYKEYHDGILLFSVATEEVWDKASKDEEGLKSYFESHRAKYNYEAPRFKGAFIECVDDSVLIATLKGIYADCNDYQKAADRVREEVLKDTLLTPDPKHPRFHIVHGIYAPGDNPTVDRDCLKIEGANPNVKKTMPVQFTWGKVLEVGPEELADVRNAVVADYQNELEKVWVEKLRNKFSWKLNEKELNLLRK